MCFYNCIRKKAFDSLKTIYDYKTNGYKASKPRPESIKVCFLDDEGYDIERFRKTGYSQVERITSYQSPNQFVAYDVIICDIDGVGVDIDKKRQGLAVVQLLKEQFPEKLVLVFSSKNPLEYDEDFYSTCDGFFPKIKTPSEIAAMLNKKAAIFWDPIAAWSWCESYLRKKEIPNKTIAFLEDKYVRSLEDKVNLFDSDTDLQKMKGVAEVIGIISQMVLLVLPK